jgi:hypothetical protein
MKAKAPSLCELERENQRLKQVVADQTLDAEQLVAEAGAEGLDVGVLPW